MKGKCVMDIDKKDLDAIASLSDGEFLKKMENALESTGAAEEVKKRFTENVPLLKQTLSTLSPRDIELLLQRIDSDTLDKIRKSFEE